MMLYYRFGMFVSHVLPWVVFAILVNGLAKLIFYFDLNKRAYNHVPGNCHSVAAVEDGAEDIEYLGNGLVLYATGLRMYPAPELNATKGKVYLYNFTANSAWELTINGKRLNKNLFNPHGMTSWTTAKGKTRTIYIINHLPKGDQIETFVLDIKRKALNHTRTIRSKFFYNLNNIVAIGQDKLFGVNFHYFNKTWLQNAEILLKLRMGSIFFYNGSSARLVDRWTLSPNGIAWDKSKRHLLVSSFLGSEIKVFKINSFSNGSITELEPIPLATNPDNLWVEPTTGDIFVGCHPIKYKWFTYQSKPKTLMSPSQVLKLSGQVGSKKPMEVTQLFASDGATLSASSVAVKYKHQLMIGSLHSRLLICDIHDNPDFNAE